MEALRGVWPHWSEGVPTKLRLRVHSGAFYRKNVFHKHRDYFASVEFLRNPPQTLPSLQTRYAQAISIAENELALRAIRERQVECVERLREITAEPFAAGDNGIKLSKAVFQRALLAREQILRMVPFFLEKYKDQVETQANKSFPSPFDIVPLELKVLLQGPETIEEEERALDLARKQIKERDEFEAFEQAAIDLIHLDRYERRAWSRQKRAIRAFMKLKRRIKTLGSVVCIGRTTLVSSKYSRRGAITA